MAEPNDSRSLDEVLAEIWRDLAEGVRSKHPFHLPVLGTVRADAPDGAGSDQRMVVLRAVDQRTRRLFANTDRRSEKIASIESNPRVSWLFYHPEKKYQVRVRGRARLHVDDDVAAEHWARATLRAKRCYCGAAPGRPSPGATTGLPPELTNRAPTPEESEAGRGNFAVIATTIDTIDWLELAFDGHTRARFTWTDTGERDATWIAP